MMKPLSILVGLTVGVSLWLITDWVTHRVLTHSQRPVGPLTLSLYPTTQFSQSLTIVSIEADIDCAAEITEVTLETTHAALTRLEFKFPLVEPSQIEAALNQALGSPERSLTSMIRYRSSRGDRSHSPC